VHVHNMVSPLLKRLGAFETAAVAADRAYLVAGDTYTPRARRGRWPGPALL
jgi:hypothetical protein